MNPERSLLDYQAEAAKVVRLSVRPATEDGEPPWTRKAAMLYLEGWTRKVRCGKRIWQKPDTGDWYSEEVAYALIEGGER